MDHEENQGLLQSFLGLFARRGPERLTQSPSLRSQAADAWMRADAFLQHEDNDVGERDPEQVERALRAFENLVQHDPSGEADSPTDTLPEQTIHRNSPYPNLRRAVHHMKSNANPDSRPTIRISKRKRENDVAMEALEDLDKDAKKRRVVVREEPTMDDDTVEPDAEEAITMRKHSMSLHQGLRNHWMCVCRKCSGLSVRLSLPQRKTSSQGETCFDVFFGVQDLIEKTSLQEAKITVKDVQSDKGMSNSKLTHTVLSEFAHICQCITESLDQRTCLNLLFEDGLFKRLRPQPKTFGDSPTPRTISLSSLFDRQQELVGGSSVLPLKGKRILAVVLATALLPFLETPWVQPSFSHSSIQFFQPLDGELPNITKPFLDMRQVPIISPNKQDSGNGEAELASSHIIHPNASVLALGILLCELHYCKPVESWQDNPDTARNLNSSFYTSLEILKNLEADAGVDYYLATKACLQWEYFPAGEPDTSFESASVQRLFYQNVIKRLESELFRAWHLRSEDLNSLDSRANELCWGPIGREVVHAPASKHVIPVRSKSEPVVTLSPTSKASNPNDTLQNQAIHLQLPIPQPSRNLQTPSQLVESSAQSLYLFDATYHTVSELDTALSEKWMNNLLSSIHSHVDSFDNAMQPTWGLTQHGSRSFEPVRIAILDSGYDPASPHLINDNPRIKGVRNFVHGTNSSHMQDEIGHGTHTLGLLLKFATCAEIYVARVANQETLGRDSYDAITEAINHAVTEWNVDIITMSFGIREYHEPMKKAIVNALSKGTLMFAAASNDGANLGRAFPAKYPSVFCIHSTDGNGNPSTFNPTADDKDVNFSLLGQSVRSHWPPGLKGHHDNVNVLSGTSVATPIAAGLAASLLSFVHQEEQGLPPGTELLGPWLKDVHSMDAVLKSMVKQRGGYDYIAPHVLFDQKSSREHVYNKIKDIKKHMYD